MRYWRIVGNFHTIGEVIDVVEAPNWTGGLRKGALALKRNPKTKGRKITMGSFTIQETTKDVYLTFHPLSINGAVQQSLAAQPVEGTVDQKPEPIA